MLVYRFTHLGRPFDLSANWPVVTLTAAGAVAGLLFPGDRSPAPAMIATAGSVFLAWALTRELTPDHPAAAMLAAAAAGAAVLWSGETNLAALAGLMVAARILVRTTGLRPLLTDIAVVGVLAGMFARTPLSWATGLALAAAVALDTSLEEPAPWPHVWLAGAMGVAVTLTAVVSEALPRAWEPPDALTIVLALVALGTLLTAATGPLRSSTDRGRRTLDSRRLRTARLVASGALLLGTGVGGHVADHASWPAWLALLAAGVWRGRR